MTSSTPDASYNFHDLKHSYFRAKERGSTMAAASFDAMPKRKSKITAKCVRGERHDNFAQKLKALHSGKLLFVVDISFKETPNRKGNS